MLSSYETHGKTKESVLLSTALFDVNVESCNNNCQQRRMVKKKGKFILMAWCFLLSCKGSNYTCTLFHVLFTVWGFYFLTLRYWNLFMLPSASKSPSPLFSGLSNSLLLWQALLFRQNPNQNNQKKPWLAIMLRWGKTICKLKKAHVHAHTDKTKKPFESYNEYSFY